MTENTRFAVLLEAPEAPFEAAAVLAALKNCSVPDAQQMLRRAWGIVSDQLDAATAETWQKQFAAKGVATRVLETGRLWTPPAPSPIKSLSFEMQTLSPAAGAAVSCPWSSLALIAACAYSETTGKNATPAPQGPSAAQRIASAGIFLTTGLPIKLGGKKPKEQKVERTTEAFLLIDLIPKGGAARYRLNAREFDYGCLGARKGYSAQVNAKSLLRELTQRAPQARQNFGVQHLLANRQDAMPYRTPEDLDGEQRALLSLA